MSRLRRWSELVTFSHTVFMMPFAASAVVLAFGEPHVSLTVARAAAMIVCMVSARTSAMAFNRWADRNVDAANPRTKGRPVPSGRVSSREALVVTGLSGAVFCGSAATLGVWPAVLSVPVLAVLLGYSLAKRVTWLSHSVLGLALALAPGGAWVAMGAKPNGGIISLMVGVLFWLQGFDVLYALQDEGFDRSAGLHSIPARFGSLASVRIAALSHTLTVACFAAAGALLQRGAAFFLGVLGVGVVLAIEHSLVRTRDGRVDLSRIGKAFFNCNAYVSLGFFVATLADALAR